MDDSYEASPIDQKHCDEVALLFINMGAGQAQAQTMAKQLLKRARQIAQSRDMTEIEALETLLKRVIEVRNDD